MKNKVYIVLSIIVFLLMVTGCKNNFESYNAEYSSDFDKATVNLSFEEPFRTVLPDIELTELTDFVLEGKLKNKDEADLKKSFSTLKEAKAATFVIEPGIWNFSLTAKKKNVVFRGSLSNVTLSAGANTLSFVMEFYSLGEENDTGNVSITLTFPSDAGVKGIRAGLFSLKDDTPIESIPLKSLRIRNNEVTYSVNSVPVGNYRFKAYLYADDSYITMLNTYREIVSIASGCTSSAQRSLSSVNTMYSITFNNDSGLFTDSYIVPENYSKNSEIQLPTAENIKRDGYAFVGWYENKDFSGQRVTKIKKNSTGNKTYYAKWAEGYVVNSSSLATLDLSKISKAYTVAAVGDINLELLAEKIKSAVEPVSLDLFAISNTELKNQVFADCEKLIEVVLPESLVSIGAKAFLNCTNLKSIFITDSINSVGINSFGNCSALEIIDVSENSKNYKSVEGILFSKNCDVLIQYPAGKTNASYLIPEGVIKIEDSAFYGNKNLTSVIIGKDVADIVSTAFNNCSLIASYIVDAQNKSYYTDSDILYNEKDGNCILIRYPVGKTEARFVLPSWVYEISDNAFYGCKNLEVLQVPSASELTCIGSYAFSGCSNLLTFDIPYTVTAIGQNAFEDCIKLSNLDLCTITFMPNGGAFEEYKQSAIKDNSVVLLSSKRIGVIRTGYSFKGWAESSTASEAKYNDGDSILLKNNLKLYAVWKPNSYKIIFNANGGEGTMKEQTFTYGTESALTKNIYTKAGYSFKGWNTKEDGSGDSLYDGEKLSKFTSEDGVSIILYAQWGEVTYPITYYLNGGKNSSANPVSYSANSANIVLAEPTREGYSFAGWYTDSKFTGNSVKEIICKNAAAISLYAKWNLVSYLIKYELNGGIQNNTNPNTYSIETETITLAVPVREGYIFGGWYTNQNFTGDKITKIAKGSSGNITLYANWKEAVQTITAEDVYTLDWSTFSAETTIYITGTIATEELIFIADALKTAGANIILDFSNAEITLIDSYAFQDCTKLSHIIVPDTVSSIGEGAFMGCSALKDIKIPSAVTVITAKMFSGCSSLNKVEMTDSVTSIATRAFYGCSSLPSITLSSKLTKLESYAFYGCTKLQSIEIPAGVTNIGDNAFNGCEKLASLTIASTVTTISDYAFYNCAALQKLVIPEGVASLGNYSFYHCTGIAAVSLPDTLKTIGTNAFQSCTNLLVIKIPDSVTSMGCYAFQNCTSLKNATLSNSADIPAFAFESTSLALVTVPEGVKSIGERAFANCTNLKTVNLPASLEDIKGPSLFASCSTLTKINYSGTKSEWGVVSNRIRLYTHLSSNCIFECSDGIDSTSLRYTGTQWNQNDLKWVISGYYTCTATISLEVEKESVLKFSYYCKTYYVESFSISIDGRSEVSLSTSSCNGEKEVKLSEGKHTITISAYKARDTDTATFEILSLE